MQLPGAEVNYVEIGEGEPILFVHGLGGCWRTGSRTSPTSAARQRAIALDLPGFGDSPLPSWPIEMPAYGRLIHDFCEKLGIDRVAALVGNSMGGFAATEAVIDSPCGSTGWSSSPPPGSASPRPEGARSSARRAATFKAAIRLPAAAPKPARPGPAGASYAFGGSSATRTGCGPSCSSSRWTRACARPASPTRSAAIGGYDTRHRLTEIEIPTLVVWGINDRSSRSRRARLPPPDPAARAWSCSSAPATCRSWSGRRASTRCSTSLILAPS